MYIGSHQAVEALCYPRTVPNICSRRAAELESLGVQALCLDAPKPLTVGPVRVLGKGHSGVVLLGVMRDRIVAIKVRRIDSRRQSLESEARLQIMAAHAGAAPVVHAFTDDFIVSDAVLGPTLGDILQATTKKASLYKILTEALNALLALDLAGVLHNEIHRPWRNILYTSEPPNSKALIVDFDSASEGCGNLAKASSWITRVLGLRIDDLRSHIREYKRLCHKDPYSLYNILLDNIEYTLMH